MLRPRGVPVGVGDDLHGHVDGRARATRRATRRASFRAQPRRWREGQRPDPENRDRIIGLDAVLALLSGFLAESSIPKWLTGVNAHLDSRRPVSVLKEGRIADVIVAIKAQKGEAYA